MRQDLYQVTATVDGSQTGVWDKCDGGEVDSNEIKYKPGGLSPERSLGGTVTISNVTITRLHDVDRDNALRKRLLSRVGKAPVTVTKQPLDADGNPKGSPDIYTGVLKKVTSPEADSAATSAALWALEISTVGSVG